MRIDVYHHIVADETTVKKLDAILAIVTPLAEVVAQTQRRLGTMSKEMDDLTAMVARTLEVEQSAQVLIEGLSAQLKANKDDPAAIEALAGQLDAQAANLAAAVTQNTPAADTGGTAPGGATNTTGGGGATDTISGGAGTDTAAT